MYTLSVSLCGRGLDWQIASAAQVCRTLRTVFSSVEHLAIKYYGHNKSSRNGVVPDRTQWRELLGSFVNVKTLFVGRDYVGQLSNALQPGEGESPTELLPELQELSCPAINPPVDGFTPFIDARQRAGRPVTIIHASESRPFGNYWPGVEDVEVCVFFYAWNTTYMPCSARGRASEFGRREVIRGIGRKSTRRVCGLSRSKLAAVGPARRIICPMHYFFGRGRWENKK